MSLKSWIRNVLGVQPQVIEKTVYVYPKSNSNNDKTNAVINKHSYWFHLTTFSGSCNYESKVLECIIDLLGPTYAPVYERINGTFNLFSMYCHRIPPGTVVMDYIKSKPELLKRLYEYQQIESSEQYELTELQFRAYRKLSARLLDLKLVNFDEAEEIETVLDFVKRFTREEIKEEVRQLS